MKWSHFDARSNEADARELAEYFPPGILTVLSTPEDLTSPWTILCTANLPHRVRIAMFDDFQAFKNVQQHHAEVNAWIIRATHPVKESTYG